MTTLLVDGQAVTLDGSVQTWAEVLRELDVALDSRGRVLTEVQFDGVGEPTYRDPPALDRPLSSMARIDVTTATPDALLKDCLRAGAESIGELLVESEQAAGLFRAAHVPQACARLAAIASGLAQLVVLVRTLEEPLRLVGTALATVGDESHQLQRLTTLVEALLEAQRSTDHYAVADSLEYDLAPLLQQWQARFLALAA